MIQASPFLTRDGQALQDPTASIMHTVTVDLTDALDGEPVDCGPIRTITAITVTRLRGRAEIGATYAQRNPVREGDVREGLALTALYLSTDGWIGGTITLELHGRP